MRKPIMPRLKTLLACAGLSSLTRRAEKPRTVLDIEPIRRPLDDCKPDAADDWLFESNTEASMHASALDGLTASLGRLRESLSRLASHAPITVEAEPAMMLGAMSFDRDLFDGEPMMTYGDEAGVTGLHADLFDDSRVLITFGADNGSHDLFQQAA